MVDVHKSLIRKVSSTGDVTTFAGTGLPGHADGTGTTAVFNYPSGITIDGFNNLFSINPDGNVTTFAGQLASGSINGTGTAASFDGGAGIKADTKGNMIMADGGNNLMRKITSNAVAMVQKGTYFYLLSYKDKGQIKNKTGYFIIK